MSYNRLLVTNHNNYLFHGYQLVNSGSHQYQTIRDCTFLLVFTVDNIEIATVGEFCITLFHCYLTMSSIWSQWTVLSVRNTKVYWALIETNILALWEFQFSSLDPYLQQVYTTNKNVTFSLSYSKDLPFYLWLFTWRIDSF